MSHQAGPEAQRSSERTLLSGRDAAANKAHDLCNQLQVVESALNIIRRSTQSTTSAALDDVIEFARAAVDRAGRLSRAIVDARTQCGTRSRVSIAERLAALPEIGLLASGSNILIEHCVCDDVPDVLCDPDALSDAILNIVVNACRAMPGGGRILIGAVREIASPEGLPFAVLRIADTGCGMSPGVAARALEPNFTTRRCTEGSGLGLAMVADFARAVGGAAELESRLGVGTVITLRLPGLIKRAREARGRRYSIPADDLRT